MKKLLMILPLVILLCFTFGCQQGEEVAEEVGVKPLSDEDVAAIKALGPALDKAALAKEWDTILSLFTEDSMLMGPNMPVIKGRSGHRAFIESLKPSHTEHRIDIVEVDGYGDIAYGICTYSEALTVGGGEQIEDKGKILGVFRKQSDGQWRIALWSFNSDLPLPE